LVCRISSPATADGCGCGPPATPFARADDDAQQGQERAQQVGADRAQRDADAFQEAHGVPACASVRCATGSSPATRPSRTETDAARVRGDVVLVRDEQDRVAERVQALEEMSAASRKGTFAAL